MIGTRVEHPQYGQGQIVALYRNGSEWMVRFDNGLRFRRPRQEFNGQHTEAIPIPAKPLSYMPPTPMPHSRFEARQLIEALRMGVAPAQHVQELTIGLEEERASIIQALNQAHQDGGAVRVVVGEYGFGKSHIVELTAQEALARNFLVATTSLDLLELPPHRAFNIYSNLTGHIRYPDTDEVGLGPLLEKVEDIGRIRELLRELSPAELDPLVVALDALHNTSLSRPRAAWQRWLMGGRRLKIMNKAMPRGIKFPSIYKVGDNARQIAYLLTGISALARLANYSGLCVLLDEAESYSLLRSVQRPKANLFFSAMIYAALREGQSNITADMFPQHRWRDYPLAYDAGQSLFFLFTITHSDNRLPLDTWLEDDQILQLASHQAPHEISSFLKKVEDYHAQAYDYEPGERQGQVRRAAAEHMALATKSGRLSIRGVVRLSVELFDLLYLHPDYESAQLLDELRSQMRR